MADLPQKTFSAHTAITSVAGTDTFLSLQSGVVYQTTLTQIKNWTYDEVLNFTSLTAPDDSDVFYINSGAARRKVTYQVLKNYFTMPIGQYIALDADHTAISSLFSSLPDGVVLADGSLISDSESPYNGYRVRNLNQADVSLTVTWTADSGGSYATIAATDIPALNVGDTVDIDSSIYTGYITDITGTTVTISSTTATGTDTTSVFTGRARYITGASTSGGSRNDAMQRLTGTISELATGATGTTAGAFSSTYSNTTYFGTTVANRLHSITFNSANSTSPNTAKTDDENTRGPELDFVYVTRIK